MRNRVTMVFPDVVAEVEDGLFIIKKLLRGEDFVS